ncbi:MAG TPA: hypothetical protein VGC74_15555 [Stenotrophomonas sp.]|jgi:hypothetical protein
MHDALAYAGFLFWIIAGLSDFALHRRSDLAHTSGLAESSLHLVQLGLIGGSVAAWWALAPSWGAWCVAAALVLAHAVVGYLDTRSAYGKRAIVPLEQHVHSVLDAAPWIFLGGYATQLVVPGLGLHWQPRAASLLLWLGIPGAMVAACAAIEFAGAWRAARNTQTR